MENSKLIHDIAVNLRGLQSAAGEWAEALENALDDSALPYIDRIGAMSSTRYSVFRWGLIDYRL